MSIEISRVIVWLIVGALAGSMAGMLLARRREGFGRVKNLLLGLVGALIGGGLTRLFKIDLGLGNISVSLGDLVAALIGSLLFVAGVTVVQWIRARKRGRNGSGQRMK